LRISSFVAGFVSLETLELVVLDEFDKVDLELEQANTKKQLPKIKLLLII